MFISRSVLRRMRNVSDRIVEQIKTHILWLVTFFSRKSYIYEVMRNNVVQPDRSQIIIRRMRIACWIPKATNTHSEYVILIAFPLQQWLHERALQLPYTLIACLVYLNIIIWSVFLVERDFILCEERNECLSALQRCMYVREVSIRNFLPSHRVLLIFILTVAKFSVTAA